MPYEENTVRKMHKHYKINRVVIPKSTIRKVAFSRSTSPMSSVSDSYIRSGNKRYQDSSQSFYPDSRFGEHTDRLSRYISGSTRKSGVDSASKIEKKFQKEKNAKKMNRDDNEIKRSKSPQISRDFDPSSEKTVLRKILGFARSPDSSPVREEKKKKYWDHPVSQEEEKNNRKVRKEKKIDVTANKNSRHKQSSDNLRKTKERKSKKIIKHEDESNRPKSSTYNLQCTSGLSGYTSGSPATSWRKKVRMQKSPTSNLQCTSGLSEYTSRFPTTPWRVEGSTHNSQCASAITEYTSETPTIPWRQTRNHTKGLPMKYSLKSLSDETKDTLKSDQDDYVNAEISYYEFGKAQVVMQYLGYLDSPLPMHNHSVVIKVEASTVSVTDVLMRKNLWREATPLPNTPGVDCVGRILRCGKNASSYGIKNGDRVVALAPYLGGNARYVARGADQVVKIPETVDAAQAACIVRTYLTAHQCLSRAGKNPVKKGDSVLVIGGNGAVAQAVIQLARIAGASRIFATVCERYRHMILKIGAIPLPREPEDWLPQVKGQMDIVIDGVCAEGFSSSYAALRNNSSKLVCYGTSSHQDQKTILGIPIASMWLVTQATWLMSQTTYFDVFSFNRENPSMFKKDLISLFQLLQDKLINPMVAKKILLKEVPDAHDLIEAGGVIGQIVCFPWMGVPSATSRQAASPKISKKVFSLKSSLTPVSWRVSPYVMKNYTKSNQTKIKDRHAIDVRTDYDTKRESSGFRNDIDVSKRTDADCNTYMDRKPYTTSPIKRGQAKLRDVMNKLISRDGVNEQIDITNSDDESFIFRGKNDNIVSLRDFHNIENQRNQREKSRSPRKKSRTPRSECSFSSDSSSILSRRKNEGKHYNTIDRKNNNFVDSPRHQREERRSPRKSNLNRPEKITDEKEKNRSNVKLGSRKKSSRPNYNYT